MLKSSADAPAHAAAAPPALRDISAPEIAALGAEISRSGHAVIPGYLAPATLAALRHFAEALPERDYLKMAGKPAFAGTLLDAIADSPAFLALLHGLYETAMRQPAPAQSLYQVLRCLRGPLGAAQALKFHYDSYVVTALLPLVIPQGGDAGHLLMAPNRRPVRRTYLRNLADKLLIDNRLAQSRFARHARRFQEIRMVPGDLYLFWGYRSLHANLPCDPARLRATALYHFGDPHAQSRLRRLTGRARVRAQPHKSA